MLQRVLAALRTAISVPTFFVFTLIVAAYCAAVVTVAPRSEHIEKVIDFWSRRFLSIAPVRYTVEGAGDLDPTRTYVFVANHLSAFDIPVLFLAIPIPIRYLAKKELFKIPILAQGMRRIGIVEIDRQAHGAAHASINSGVSKAIERGHSIIVFAEGHRSEDRELQAFKKGAFRIAIDNQLPVVPVTIQGTWDVWKPGSKIIRPGVARVVIHDPIEVDDMERQDLGRLVEQTRTIISDQYDRMRAGSPQS